MLATCDRGNLLATTAMIGRFLVQQPLSNHFHASNCQEALATMQDYLGNTFFPQSQSSTDLYAHVTKVQLNCLLTTFIPIS